MKNGFLISLLPNCEHAYRLNVKKVKTEENFQCNDQKDINATGLGSLSNNEQTTTSPNDKENNAGNDVYVKIRDIGNLNGN